MVSSVTPDPTTATTVAASTHPNDGCEYSIPSSGHRVVTDTQIGGMVIFGALLMLGGGRTFVINRRCTRDEQGCALLPILPCLGDVALTMP